MAYTRNKGKSTFIQSSSYAHAPAILSPKKEILLGNSLGLGQCLSQHSAPTKRQKPFRPASKLSRHCLKPSGISKININISYVAAGQCHFETVSAGIMGTWRKYKDIILYDNSHISSLRIFSRYDMQLRRPPIFQCAVCRSHRYPSHLAKTLYFARHFLMLPEMKQSTCVFIVAPCIS